MPALRHGYSQDKSGWAGDTYLPSLPKSSKGCKMIYFLTGNNSYAQLKRLKELTENFREKHGDLAVEKYDGEEAEAEKMLAAINSLPFLAPKKMVVIRNASRNKLFCEQIEQIISSIPESTDIVFYEPLTDRRTIFYKTLKNETQCEEYDELSSAELAKW